MAQFILDNVAPKDDADAHYADTNNPHNVTAAQVGINDTDDLTEGSTNKYFTEARVKTTPLTGFSVGSNTTISATDTVAGAFAKTQGQINARPNETATSIAAINHGTAEKTSLVDADEVTGQDSASSFSLIRTTWTNVKAFLKTYFDGIYTAKNNAITGATKTKITYDSKGLVTSGADATTADIADSSNKRYVTDAQLTIIGNTSGTNTGDQDLSGYQLTSGKEATGGYAGLTLFKINFKNIANTFTSFFTNSNSAARTYTFPDKDGTVAMTSDITGTNSGINTGDETAKRVGALINSAEGIMLNGKLSVTVASNNITVALKTLAGADASSSDPIYIMIGGVLRTITAALSVTKNAGTNWFNSGSTALATYENDYFVYLGFNATDGVVIGFARIPYATKYGDFSATTTNENYCAISTISNAVSTDYYNVIGRFAATLSATASFNWSVPTFTAANLINHPIYESRWLTYGANVTGFSAFSTNVVKYQVAGMRLYLEANILGTSNAATFTLTIPLGSSTTVASFMHKIIVMDNGTLNETTGLLNIDSGSPNTINIFRDWAGTAFTTSGSKRGYIPTITIPLT